jgi:tetratricopeptide (TPR) repeat protein
MMSSRRSGAWILVLVLVLVLVGVGGAAGAARASNAAPVASATPPPPPDELGRIEFPVTASPPARQHFVRGVLAMHSFWYEEARDEFQAATRLEPGFAMGYWGEALTYFHPVWGEENLVGERAALARIPAGARLTAREEGLISAARILVGTGGPPARWIAYADALRGLHQRFPEDDEVATLLAVALLGNGYRDREGGTAPADFRPFAEAAALGLEVLGRNPRHPGAAHYVIHAFDDPEHAVLALPAARVYAQIAPEASHARHMPSHIFVQLGMWPEADAANESAWAASQAWIQRKHLDPSLGDFHSLSWLQAIALEQGQVRRAREILMRGFAALKASRDPNWMPLFVGGIGAAYVVMTGDWPRMDEMLAPLRTVRHTVTSSATQAAMPGCKGHVEASAARAGLSADAWLAFTEGEAAAARADLATLTRSRAALAAIVARMTVVPFDADIVRDWKIRNLELDARSAELGRAPGEVVSILRSAATLDESVPASGVVGDILPRERLGEYLLAQGRAPEALAELRRALRLHPRRARSLLGAARAARAAGDPSARGYYAELAKVWAHADGAPAVIEARTLAATP